jgi:hypothetical protein
VPLDRGGWYTLDLVHQPTLLPDLVSLRVEVPPGYLVRAAEGIEVLGPHTAGGDIALSETGRVRVRVGKDPSFRG